MWPFHAGVPPVVVEVWPRALTGPVVKSRADARVAYLAERYPAIDGELATRAARSEDAFDAAVSALVMAAHVTELGSLPPVHDPTTRLEGAVWLPSSPWTARARTQAAPGYGFGRTASKGGGTVPWWFGAGAPRSSTAIHPSPLT